MLGAKRVCFTLDDVGSLDPAERDPESLHMTRPVTLDEVKRAPQLLLAVKQAVDERSKAGDFALTRSANLLLMAIRLGAGRLPIPDEFDAVSPALIGHACQEADDPASQFTPPRPREIDQRL